MSKTANLLVDGLGQPSGVGLLLPLHWQTLVILMAAVAANCPVTLADEPAALAGCAAAFVLAEHAQAVVDLDVDDVLVLSGHPLGAPAVALPIMTLDYAREVPSHADHFSGPRPGAARIELAGTSIRPLEGLDATDRVLTALSPTDQAGAAVLLGALRSGASLVLLRAADPVAVAAAERATATAGCSAPGLRQLA